MSTLKTGLKPIKRTSEERSAYLINDLQFSKTFVNTLGQETFRGNYDNVAFSSDYDMETSAGSSNVSEHETRLQNTSDNAKSNSLQTNASKSETKKSFLKDSDASYQPDINTVTCKNADNKRSYVREKTVREGETENGCCSAPMGTNGEVKNDETKERKLLPGLARQVFGAVGGSLLHMSIGTIVGLTGVILPSLTSANAIGDLVMDTQQASLFNSLLNAGAMVGSVLSGPLMVSLGQRNTLLSALPVALIGWFILAFSRTIWLLMVARILLGITVGVFGGPSANYVAEISHSSVRGRLAGLIDLARQIGFLFVYVVGSSGLTWRMTAVVCGCVTTLIPFGTLWFLPNSPRWLATKSRINDARNSLRFYRGGDTKSVERELEDINEQLQKTSRGSDTKSQLNSLRQPSVLKRLTFLSFMFMAYQFTGNFSMIVYSVTIFQSAQSSLDEYTSTIVVGCVRIFGVCGYIFVADKLGRRILLLSSLVCSSLAMGVLGLSFYMSDVVKQPSTAESTCSILNWLPLVSSSTFIFFTCIAEPALILIRAELLPTSVRSLGVSIIYIFFFTGAFLVSYLYPVMVQTIGSYGVFWTYAIDGALMAVVGYTVIPETKSKTLEDIEKSFCKKSEFELAASKPMEH